MKPLLIAQSMTDIDDKFILGSMPPPLVPAEKPPRFRFKAPLLIFGSVAAAFSVLLTVSLIVSLVNLGSLNPFAPPNDTEETTVTSEDTEAEQTTESETEPEPEAPTVFSEGLAFQQNPDGTYLVAGIGTCKDSDVAIPPTYEGYPVVGIDEGAFYENSQLTSIYVPGSVTYIGTKAFYKCPALTSVTLAEGVTEIDIMAFYRCPALTSVSLPNSIRNISTSVFSECPALQVNTYDHANYLGNRSNPYIALISCPRIGFSSCEVHENTRVIAGGAFDGCNNLTSISIPNGVISVGFDAFDSCDNLNYNTYDSVRYLGNEENPYVVLTKATSTGITSCSIPEGTRVIMPGAFQSCTKMVSVTIPDGVVFIGKSAFYHCYKLKSVVIPKGVTEIRDSTFYYCTEMTSVTIPDGVTGIGNNAFQNCAIRSISLPDSLTHIGEAAFKESSLEYITLPSSVTSVGNFAFAECSGLSSVTLSENLSVLSESMFYYCVGLTNITIPEGVTRLGMHAFEFCVNLSYVTLPQSLRSIDNGVFRYCSALGSIVIPEGVTSLGQIDVTGFGVFSDCSNLAAVYLPKSLTSISYAPFGSCEKLTRVYYAGSEEEWSSIDKGTMWDACFPLGATLYYNSEP